MRFVAALFLAVAPVVAADEDPTEILIRLREQVLAHADRIPNYTCVETIHRDRYEPALQPPKSCDDLTARRTQPNFSSQLRLATTDRLRLDVALTPEREIYSWAGAARFADGDIDQVIPDGAMGSGPFAVMLLGVFQGRPPRFTFEGEEALDHRLVYEYSYRVPREESHYRIKARQEWIITGYDATLWVDAKTAELVRLDVRTDELPPETSLCQSRTSLEYGMVQLGKAAFLLPKSSRQRFIGRDGVEGENLITFAGCREFRGQSTVRFGEGASASDVAVTATAAAVALPTGLPVSVDLASAVDDNAAAGDRIQGRLAKAVRDAKGAVLIPEGAALEGRLMRVEIRHTRKPEAVLSFRWETVEIAGERRPIALLPNRHVENVKVEAFPLRRRGVEIELPPASDVHYGVYHFAGDHVAVYPGFRTEWTTAVPQL